MRAVSTTGDEDIKSDETIQVATTTTTAAAAAAAPAASSSSPKRWRLSKLHRIVEQDGREPICVLAFKWTVILVGLAMLAAVIYYMGEVVYSWGSGTIGKTGGGSNSSLSGISEGSSSSNPAPAAPAGGGGVLRRRSGGR